MTGRITDAELGMIRARASGVDLLALYDVRLALSDRARLLREVDALRAEAARGEEAREVSVLPTRDPADPSWRMRGDGSRGWRARLAEWASWPADLQDPYEIEQRDVAIACLRALEAAEEAEAHGAHTISLIADALDPSIAATPTWPELAIRVWKACEEGRHGRDDGEAERAGNAALRARHGAREGETMEGFVGRLAREAQAWRTIDDLVHELDHRSAPGGVVRMADDDVLDIVARVLRNAVRRETVGGENADQLWDVEVVRDRNAGKEDSGRAMSRTEVVEAVACPECHVAVGAPCVGARGGDRTAVHAGRWRAARIPSVDQTLFTCRMCDRPVSGWTDGAVVERGWRTIENIDGPNAICPACVEYGHVDVFHDEYENAKIGAAMPVRTKGA